MTAIPSGARVRLTPRWSRAVRSALWGVRLLLRGCLSFAAGLGVAFRGGVGRWAGILVRAAAGIAKPLIHALV